MKKMRAKYRGEIEKSENRILLAFLLNLIFSFVEVWGGLFDGEHYDFVGCCA